MAELIQGKWLSADAKQKVLESKLVALRNVVLNKSVTGGSSDVSTQVVAAATTDTPITALTALGIYVGTVTGAVDPLKVQIRAAGTDNGIDDGSGDEVYGVLSEATGVYTLTFKKADGTAFSFGTSTPIDFYFVEVYNEYSKPVNAHLLGSIGGVIDAVTADALSGHITQASDAHDASAISFVDTGLLNVTASDVQAAIADLDAALGNIAGVDPANYTASPDTNVAAHLDGIDTEIGNIYNALSSSGFCKQGVRVATTAALVADYTNGTDGVGAKLTGSSNGAIGSIDGIAVSLNDRILVKNQTAAHNGIYKITALGDGSNPFELTRVTDLDQAAEFIRGVMVSIKEGTVNARRQYFLADSVATVGTDAVTWSSVTIESLTIAESKFKLLKNEGDSFYVSFQLTSPTANRLIKVPDRDVDLEWVTKPIVEILSLDSTDVDTNKYKDLANIIKSPGIHTVSVHPVGGIEQSYGVNWTAANDGAGGVGRITWSSLGLDGILEAGDKLIVKYVVVAS